jgi:CARDB
MVDVKQSKRQLVTLRKKQWALVSVIILIFSSQIPSATATVLPQDTPCIESPPTTTEQIPSQHALETPTTTTPWWNPNWHYRTIYNITGTGNISLSVNFTQLLHNTLHVDNKTFDNTTITIIQTSVNGTMSLVNTTWFNESKTYHNHTNAAGILTWHVAVSSLYYVYFDVLENKGVRIPTPETPNLKPSETPPHATLVSTQGWWPAFTNMKTYYIPSETIEVQILTTALATNITAQVLYNNHLNFSRSIHTQDSIHWNMTITNLTKIGDWTIRINGNDDAGYQPAQLTITFYIGRPDLVATALIAPNISYIGNDVTVTGHLKALNTTVEHVDISLKVDNINVDSQKDQTITKDINTSYEFVWSNCTKGAHNLSLNIYYPPDSNQNNNIRWRHIAIEGIPDLMVLNITVSPTTVNEGTPVAITAFIKNIGDGNATDYTMVLYCEQNQNNHTMRYEQNKNSTIFSLKKNQSTNITLIWQQTRYGKTTFNGEWAVGIQILNSTGTIETPDKNYTNNKLARYHSLYIIPAERNPPLLSTLQFQTTLEIGDQQHITVKATDESGIDTVILSMKTPNKTYVNTTMTPSGFNQYEYLFIAIQIGRYNFTIKATDLSPNKNQSIITGSFTVTEDQTPPLITYYGVNPIKQLPNLPVEIRCITTDYSGIRSVVVTIQSPDGKAETHTMNTPSGDTKYVYEKSYDLKGKYSFTITVKDTLGNPITTEEKTFWITDHLDDTDTDGMPDDWEERYGLNPYDPTDATQDPDQDGITNIEEYQQGTSPLKKQTSSTEAMDRLQQNWAYLAASFIIFFIILILALYGIRRRAP